jgi:uncharacterized protein (DUF4415 family)
VVEWACQPFHVGWIKRSVSTKSFDEERIIAAGTGTLKESWWLSAQQAKRCKPMRAEYDFSKGKRRAIVPTKGKTRITVYIDDAVLDEFCARAEKAGTGYRTMMDDALKAYLADRGEEPVTAQR